MPTAVYAVADDVRAQAAPRALAQTDDELEAVIRLAEKDIDRKLPDFAPADGSLKIPVAQVDPVTVNMLAEACAAQVLYRLHMGYAFFIESHQQIGGKDFSSQGAPPKFSPLAKDILISAGILPIAGRAWQGRGLRIRTVSQRRWTW